MPSNTILINYTKSYEIHNDKMPELMKWLRENGQMIKNTKKAIYSHKKS
jgi:phage antirepressor YoqD-like protein